MSHASHDINPATGYPVDTTNLQREWRKLFAQNDKRDPGWRERAAALAQRFAPRSGRKI